MFDLQQLEKLLGYEFNNKNLLKTAVTHSSYSHIHGGKNYQRLEFLGDSIVDFLVAEELGRRFADADEGRLTKMRVAVVSAPPLAKIVEEKGFDKFLYIGAVNVGEKIRSDVFESISAAIYLDGGIDSARQFVVNSLEPLIAKADENCKNDYKTALYEKFCGKNIIFKEVAKTGKEHCPVFEVELYIDGQLVATGRGETKKSAQQACAKIALSGN